VIHFRQKHLEVEFDLAHPNLRKLARELDRWLELKGLDLYVTSIFREAGTIKGESGVHATLRALDGIPDGKDWNAEEMSDLAEFMNNSYPRKDGKPSVLWHSHRGGGLHFHLQVEWISNFNENKLVEEIRNLKKEK